MSEITISDIPKCKHYNVGYCRYKETCKLSHPKEDCENQNCSDKKCPNRHRRRCRFGKSCRRKEICEFIHKPKDSDCDISELKAQVEGLKNTVADMSVKIENLEKELKNHQTPRTETYNMSTEDFKCDKCGVVYKKEATLIKHMNTKHQLDIAEVEVVVKNSSNEKELKLARRQIKELEDKVESLSLGKARAEAEVRSNRVENDSLASLLSMRQNINKPLSKQSPAKKKK